MGNIVLRPLPLTAAAFQRYGEVIEPWAKEPRLINEGTCRRFDDLATVDTMVEGGRPLISVFESEPRELPLRVRALERHPLSSQAFYPLDPWPFLIVVADDAAAAAAGCLQVFSSSGTQGVNYHRNTWHHSLIAVGRLSRFLVVDRGGPLDNCDEVSVEAAVWVTAASDAKVDDTGVEHS